MLRRSGAAGLGFWIGSSGLGTEQGLRAAARSPNERLQVAFVGVGGRGAANLGGVAKLPDAEVVALCDVDENRAKDSYKKHPNVRKFFDYRRMLDAMHREIDAVVISTPDHTHYHPARASMELEKHCYLEKPLAHSVAEVRTLTDLAREKKIATQLGVQRHTIKNVHRVVELIRSGAIGQVKECHAWVGGDRGMRPFPTESPPVPSHLRWDLWLGPAEERPYSKSYCPYEWRFWWDFGTGETGNWGCHILDIPYWALDLRYPVRVEASGPDVDEQRTPKSMSTRFDFPGRGRDAAVSLFWYHTKDSPPALAEYGVKHKGSGVFFVGTKGQLMCNFGSRKLYPEKDFADFEEPAPSIPASPGFYREWIDACRGAEPATCHFDYSGPMTETVLLGNVAYRAGEGFDWDAETLQASSAKANELIVPTFRKGWESPLVATTTARS